MILGLKKSKRSNFVRFVSQTVKFCPFVGITMAYFEQKKTDWLVGLYR